MESALLMVITQCWHIMPGTEMTSSITKTSDILKTS